MRGCQESPNRASEGCARGSNKVRARERAAVLRLFALRKQASALSPRRSSSARTLLMKPIATAVPPYSSAASRPSDLGREVPSLRRGGFSESELAGLAAAPPAELSTSCGGARCCAALCAAGRSPAPMLSAARRAARNAVRAEKRRTAGHGTLRHPLLGTAGDVSGACREGCAAPPATTPVSCLRRRAAGSRPRAHCSMLGVRRAAAVATLPLVHCTSYTVHSAGLAALSRASTCSRQAAARPPPRRLAARR